MAAGAFLLPGFALMIGFGLAASILQNVPSPVLERIRPQLSRVSPAKGFGRIFGAAGLVEFGKALAKVLVVGTVVAIAMRGDFFDTLTRHGIRALGHSRPDRRRHAQDPADRPADHGGRSPSPTFSGSATTGSPDLRMTKQEIKDELKQTDGDPILKARQRSLQRDRARKRMMAQVPRATMVIANPTHFAVALRYVREEGGAPVVLAKGQDLVALKIREIAEAHDIPVFEDPPLARSMFAQVSVDSFIPPVFYKAVAELVHRVYAADGRRRR